MFKADAKSGGAERLAIQQFEKKAALDEEAAQLRSEIKSTELSKFRHELASRARVLQRLGHVDEDQVVQLKGRGGRLFTPPKLNAPSLVCYTVLHQ